MCWTCTKLPFAFDYLYLIVPLQYLCVSVCECIWLLQRMKKKKENNKIKFIFILFVRQFLFITSQWSTGLIHLIAIGNVSAKEAKGSQLCFHYSILSFSLSLSFSNQLGWN